MPCRSYTDEEVMSHQASEISDLQKQLDEATRMLCGVMGALDAFSVKAMQTKVEGLTDWWKVHQEMDRRRLAREEQERQGDLKRIKQLRDEADALQKKLLLKLKK
jgi:hypothetical protein